MIKIWEYLCVHIWLIFSSFGIMFAILSFFDEIGCLEDIKNKGNAMKGGLSILFGCIFYLLVGLPHVRGTNHLNKT